MECPICNSDYIEEKNITSTASQFCMLAFLRCAESLGLSLYWVMLLHKWNSPITCSNCDFPYYRDLRPDVISWARKMWMEKCSNDELFENQKYSSFSSTEFDAILDKVRQLEHKIEEQKQEKSEIKADFSKLEQELLGFKEQQSHWKTWKKRLVTLEEERSQTQERLNQLDDLATKLAEIEEYIEAEQEVSSSPNKKENKERDSIKPADEVSETEQSSSDRRLGKSKTVILESKRRGNYWIIEKEGITYLIPSNNLRVNQFNVETVKAIFECLGYQPNTSRSSDFEVREPAIVRKTLEGNNWELSQRGILQF